MIKSWLTKKEELLANLRIFNAKMITRENPLSGVDGKFTVLDSPQWVNIIPITKQNEVILVKQYRHGTDEITLEIPGGLIEKDEDPRLAGERECLEETGFASESDAILLGKNRPNPAFLNNYCYSYVWFDCELKQKQNLDIHEDIEVVTVPLKEINNYIIDGKIDHSLVLTAFFFYGMKYKNLEF
jgi:8-oxo-dGTP pyrophosphatase MutT (NUDIX family)